MDQIFALVSLHCQCHVRNYRNSRRTAQLPTHTKVLGPHDTRHLHENCTVHLRNHQRDDHHRRFGLCGSGVHTLWPPDATQHQSARHKLPFARLDLHSYRLISPICVRQSVQHRQSSAERVPIQRTNPAVENRSKPGGDSGMWTDLETHTWTCFACVRQSAQQTKERYATAGHDESEHIEQ